MKTDWERESSMISRAARSVFLAGPLVPFDWAQDRVGSLQAAQDEA
jgi:hypothetical protein